MVLAAVQEQLPQLLGAAVLQFWLHGRQLEGLMGAWQVSAFFSRGGRAVCILAEPGHGRQTQWCSGLQAGLRQRCFRLGHSFGGGPRRGLSGRLVGGALVHAGASEHA